MPKITRRYADLDKCSALECGSPEQACISAVLTRVTPALSVLLFVLGCS